MMFTNESGKKKEEKKKTIKNILEKDKLNGFYT